MSHSLVKIYVHLVWSTRDRRPTIEAAWRDRLYGAIIQAAQRLKGASSHFVNHQIGVAFQWQAAYAAYSMVYNDLMPIRNYIRNQERHHTDGDIWPELEPPDD